jgi:hypothetical protein
MLKSSPKRLSSLTLPIPSTSPVNICHSILISAPDPLHYHSAASKICSRIFKPQNVEQEISNVEVNPSSFCGSVFDIRHSLF